MTERLKIATFNVLDGADQGNLGKSLQVMEANGADVFCLQEVWKKDIGENLRSALVGDWETLCSTDEEKGKPNLGNAILWSPEGLELVDVRLVNLPSPQRVNRLDRALFKLNLLEPVTNPSDAPQREAMVADFRIGEQKIRITNLHLDWQGGTKQRLAQLGHLKGFLNSLEGVESEIICGDFNTTGLSSRKRRQELIGETLGKEFIDCHPHLPNTWNPYNKSSSDFFSRLQRVISKVGIRIPQRMDYIFARGFTVESATVEKLNGSNHYPITSSLKLP